MRSNKLRLSPAPVDDPLEYAARFGDGITATRVAASVKLEPTGLLISPADARPMQWPYADLRVAEPIRPRSTDAVLTSRHSRSASLFVDDTLLLARLLQHAAHLKLRSERWRTVQPGLAVGAMALACYASIWAFDLSPTKGIARTMPDKARITLGDSVIRTMPAQGLCNGADGRVALAKLTRRLMPNGPIAAENITVLDWAMLNAFAVPGNRIVLTRRLIEQAQSPDEIAAIIGHEAGHSIELHPEASLVRSVGFWALVQMVFTGTPGAIGNIGVVLAQLGYTRSAEREADAHALKLLQEARISPKGMAAFFRRMDQRAPTKKDAGTGGVSDILSSHPSNPERISKIDAQPFYETTPALSDEDWRALKTICGNTNGVPKPAVRPNAPAESAGKTAAPTDANSAGTTKADAVERAKRAAALAEDQRLQTAREASERRQQAAKDEADRSKAAIETARVEAARQAEAAKTEAARVEAAKQADAAKAQNEPAAGKQTMAVSNGIAGPLAAIPKATAGNLPIDERISVATKRIAANATDIAALVDRGQAFAAKQDAAAAIEDFSRALAIKPADANTLFWRASMWAQRGMLDEAVTDYSDVIKLQPRNFAAFNNRGSLYRSQKKLDLAMRDYTSAIAIDGRQAIALTNRALVHRERNELDVALVDLNAAIAANASYASAYVRRGETYELKSARDAAITDYRAVLRFPEPAGSISEPHVTARARLTSLGVKF